MNQAEFDFVAAERDQAMAQVEDAANRRQPGFSEAAENFILSLLRQGPLGGEQITNAAKRAGIVPHNDKAFGPVLGRLSRARLIEKVGFTRRRKGHLTAGGIVWRLK
jgi:hypothetical protein